MTRRVTREQERAAVLARTYVNVFFNSAGEVAGVVAIGDDGPWLVYGDTAAPQQVKYAPELKSNPRRK